MGTDLVPAVPLTVEDARSYPSAVLYQIEQAGKVSREILDERIVGWTEEGKSQRWIADEIGCSQQAVQKRQARLGISAAGPQAGKTSTTPDSDDNRVVIPEEAEVITGEPVMTNELAPPPPSRSWKRNPADQIDDIVTRVEGFTSVLGTRREGETKDQLIDVDAAIEASDFTTLREWDTKLTDAIRRLTRLRAGVRGKL